GRDHRDGLVLLARLRMAHRDDGVDADLAEFGDGLAERDGFGADRHAAEIGVEIDAGIDLAGAQAQRGADFLPVVAIAAADRLACGLDQSAIGGSELFGHFASPFSPSRISCLVSAPSPALRAAAAIAADACGWP